MREQSASKTIDCRYVSIIEWILTYLEKVPLTYNFLTGQVFPARMIIEEGAKVTHVRWIRI